MPVLSNKTVRAGQGFKWGAALEDAAARRLRDAGDEGDRCGQDERTRRRHDENRETADRIARDEPRGAASTNVTGNRISATGRRAARTAPSRSALLHQAHDARIRALAGGRRGLHSKVSPALSMPLRPTRLALDAGIGSPVSADSSTSPLVNDKPSTGTTSPARTRAVADGDLRDGNPRRDSRLRCATRGARSTSASKSRSARPTAKSSSTLPPEYMSAITTPASGSPSRRAPIIDTNAIASTPSARRHGRARSNK